MSELFLKTESSNGRTVISDRYFTAPLKIAKPFYKEDHTEIMMMCASPGMLPGDSYDYRFEIGDYARTKITAQSFQKIYTAENGFARQKTSITVGKNAELNYSPFPIIAFRGSRFISETEIELDVSSRLIYSEFLQAGRVGELYQFTEFRSSVCVKVDGKIVFIDKTILLPHEADIAGIGFMENHPCQGLTYMYGYDKPDVSGKDTAVSEAASGYCVRTHSPNIIFTYS